jgi:hypothetical protein
MVLVARDHEVHPVGVEQRQPLLADPQVGPVEMGRGHGDLVHDDHDPVDVVAATGVAQRVLQPGLLGTVA